MNPLIVKKVLFPMHEFIRRRKTFYFLSLIEKSQWFSSEELSLLQLRKLKKLLAHAGENVPYYQNIFKKLKFYPHEIKNFTDLERLPFLTKKQIRNNIFDLKAKNYPRGIKIANTSGTSGESLSFYLDNMRMAYDKAAKFRYRKWWHVDVGDREIVLWGSPVELSTQDKIKDSRDKLFNSLLLSAFDMSSATMQRYLEIIHEFNPSVIEAYPSSIFRLAKHIKETGIKFSQKSLKVIMCTGETLHDMQKSLIESVFQTPVTNGYGLREAGFVACECPFRKIHICSENVYLELIGSDNKKVSPGETGEIVITNLDMYGMPFIRYKTGDIAVASNKKCVCGRGLPLLEGIKGRTSDFIITPSGQFIHGLAFDYILEEIKGIERFKVIQKDPESLIIQLIRLPSFNARDKDTILLLAHKITNNELRITIEYVEDIPLEKSGKYRYVISELV